MSQKKNFRYREWYTGKGANDDYTFTFTPAQSEKGEKGWNFRCETIDYDTEREDIEEKWIPLKEGVHQIKEIRRLSKEYGSIFVDEGEILESQKECNPYEFMEPWMLQQLFG